MVGGSHLRPASEAEEGVGPTDPNGTAGAGDAGPEWSRGELDQTDSRRS